MRILVYRVFALYQLLVRRRGQQLPQRQAVERVARRSEVDPDSFRQSRSGRGVRVRLQEAEMSAQDQGTGALERKDRELTVVPMLIEPIKGARLPGRSLRHLETRFTVSLAKSSFSRSTALKLPPAESYSSAPGTSRQPRTPKRRAARSLLSSPIL